MVLLATCKPQSRENDRRKFASLIGIGRKVRRRNSFNGAPHVETFFKRRYPHSVAHGRGTWQTSKEVIHAATTVPKASKTAAEEWRQRFGQDTMRTRCGLVGFWGRCRLAVSG